MSLIYRAIWRDDRPDLIDQTSATFRRWATAKYGDHLLFDPEAHTSNGITTSMRSAERNGVNASEAVMVEESPSDRWMTRQRVLVGPAGEQWIWVDIERTTHNAYKRHDVVAPRLVRALLDEGIEGGGNPRIGSVRLNSRANAIPPERVESELVQVIQDPKRLVPIVVYTHAPEIDIKDTMNRATTTQEILAGAVKVVALEPKAEQEFIRLIGRDLATWGGAVRLYLPGSLEPWRHRYYLRTVVDKNIREVGRRIASSLSGYIAAQRPPSLYEEVRMALRGLVGRSIDELIALAEDEISEKDQTIQELRKEIEARDDQIIERAIDLDELNDEIEDLRRQLKYWKSLALNPGQQPEEFVEMPTGAASLTEAATQCQEFLGRVVLPDVALHDLDLMDAAPESSGWAKASWRAFRALEAYASEAEETRGGFWEWCKHSKHPDAWPATDKKLAMSESEQVMNNKAQRSARTLPVDTAVDPSGQIEMLAHMKIAEGGGNDIPRIYFYDDTKGKTGLIHVGFFGPHRYMENTKS
jgi:hypothetical protein